MSIWDWLLVPMERGWLLQVGLSYWLEVEVGGQRWALPQLASALLLH